MSGNGGAKADGRLIRSLVEDDAMLISPAYAQAAVGGGGADFFFIIMMVLLFMVTNIPAYWVLKKTGRNGWAFLLLGIPLLGLVYLCFFAFGRWPAEAGTGPDPVSLHSD